MDCFTALLRDKPGESRPRQYHRSLRWIVVSAALIVGCAPPAAPPVQSVATAPVQAPVQSTPATPPYATTLSLKQVMQWVIDPAADAVWESVAIIINDKGETQKAPKTDEEWANVRNGAAMLLESGNLLMTSIRARDDRYWLTAARRMSDAAAIALVATEKKDVAALFDSGAVIYNACSACHAKYRVGDDMPAK